MNNQSKKDIFAGFLSRIIAFQIDFLIIILPVALIGVLLLLLSLAYNIPLSFNKDILVFIVPFMFLVYFSIFNSSQSQATLGKIICNIYIGNKDKKRISLKTSIIRSFFVCSAFIPKFIYQFINDNLYIYWGAYIAINSMFLLILFNEQRATFYDFILTTRVFNGNLLNEAQNQKIIFPHLAIVPLLLIVFASVIPLFAPARIALFLIIFCMIWIACYVLFLAYKKQKDVDTYTAYSLQSSLPFIKKFGYIFAPILLLVILNYLTIFFLIKE